MRHSEPDQPAALRAQIVRFDLLDDPVGPFSFRRVENAAVAQPKGDVRRLVAAVGDQIAAHEVVVGDRGSRGLLLVGVSGDEAPQPAIGHVHETGAVDPALGHAAPEIGRPQVTKCLLDGVALGAGELVLSNPTEIVVGRLDARPAVAATLHGYGLAPEKLGDPLGVVAWLGANGGDVH